MSPPGSLQQGPHTADVLRAFPRHPQGVCTRVYAASRQRRARGAAAAAAARPPRLTVRYAQLYPFSKKLLYCVAYS